ncbi:MAG: hypothetical protein C4341_05315 [Armatimonadota bacterium]
MLTQALNDLLKLQKIDTEIHELEARFAAIDPGRKLTAAVKMAREAKDAAEAKLKEMRQELEDLQLKTKGIEQKIEAEAKRLYSGGVYNAKDAEAIDREIANLKQRRAQADERVLELWELLPAVEKDFNEKQALLQEAESLLTQHQAKYEEVKRKFVAKARSLIAKRKEQASRCDPELLERYEAVRKKRAGVGIAEVVDETCSACGIAVPKAQIDSLTGGDCIETCSNCLRILAPPQQA